jgi:hypothetical protein
MAHDAELNAQIDPMGMAVVLRARDIRNDDLAAIAEVWAEKRDLVIEHLDRLAAAVERRGAAWDTAVDDAECSWQMDEAHVRLDETQALQLAGELRDAAGQTLAARARAAQPPVHLYLPSQQDRSAA